MKDKLQYFLDPPVKLILASIVVILAIVFARSFTVGDVFRESGILLLANDPFNYWTQVGELVKEATGVFDYRSFTSFQSRDPLFVISLSWIAELAGGTSKTVALLLAIYPLASALMTAVFVFYFSKILTDNTWVGVVSAAVLSIIPAHAFRTSIGYSDHHAFDQVWLALTMLALVLILTDESSKLSREILEIFVLTIAISGQILAWIGGILYIAPVGIATLIFLVTQRSRQQLRSIFDVILALILSSIIVYLSYSSFGWHDLGTAMVPGLLAIGMMVSLFSVLILAKTNLSKKITSLVGITISVGIGGLVLFSVPALGDLLGNGIDYFGQIRSAGESQPLFIGPFWGLSGPYRLLGVLPLIGLPYLTAVSWWSYKKFNPAWTVLISYAWYFFMMAVWKRRFAAELSIPFSVVVGSGIIFILIYFDVLEGSPKFLRNPINSQFGVKFSPNVSVRKVSVIGLLIILIVSMSTAQITAITDPLGVDDDSYESAVWMAKYSQDNGLVYPDNYVFSRWGRNRMYNFLVNGHGRNFSYALGNYLDFIYSTDEKYWYRELKSKPVGFIVTTDRVGLDIESSLYHRLHNNLGSDSQNSPGIGHFRAVYLSESGSVKVFQPVDGAVLTGVGPPGKTVNIQRTIHPGGPGESFTYHRQVFVTDAGWYAVRVPYVGQYRVPTGQTRVTGTDVSTGEFVSNISTGAYWSLDANTGNVSFDKIGGHHGWVYDAQWEDGIKGSGLSFDGQHDYVLVPNSTGIDGSDGFSLTLWVRTNASVDYSTEYEWSRLISNAEVGTYQTTSGYQIGMAKGRAVGALGDGSDAAFLQGPRIDDEQWHHIALSWNGTVARFYVDGEEVDSTRFTGEVTSQDALYFGRTASHSNRFPGTLDEITFNESPNQDVRQVFESGRDRCLERYETSVCPAQ